MLLSLDLLLSLDGGLEAALDRLDAGGLEFSLDRGGLESELDGGGLDWTLEGVELQRALDEGETDDGGLDGATLEGVVLVVDPLGTDELTGG